MWNYPRPPRLERERRSVSIQFAGTRIVSTDRALRVLETTHPPTYYLPREDFVPGVLVRASGSSVCEWKGRARYWSVVVGDRRAERAAWSYPDPAEGYEALTEHVAVYCEAMDRCLVGDEEAQPQPGGFYGGWVTSWVKGPFKGTPGTWGW